jgi:hypothetical protein
MVHKYCESYETGVIQLEECVEDYECKEDEWGIFGCLPLESTRLWAYYSAWSMQ